MKSYIKIFGPPLVKALHALEKIAAESPEVLITSYFDTLCPTPSSRYAGDYTGDYDAALRNYLDTCIPDTVPTERKSKLISGSGHTLGEYDFFFEWAKDPTWEEIQDLLSKIDEALGPLGCKYTSVTK